MEDCQRKKAEIFASVKSVFMDRIELALFDKVCDECR